MASPSREISLCYASWLGLLVPLFTSIPILSFFDLAADPSPSRATYISSYPLTLLLVLVCYVAFVSLFCCVAEKGGNRAAAA
jgi:hypothetical protein